MAEEYGDYDFDDYSDDDDTDDEKWLMDCGQLADGTCMKAGSEECDWECPFGPVRAGLARVRLYTPQTHGNFYPSKPKTMSTHPLDYLTEDECPNNCEDGWIENDCEEDTCCCAEPDIAHGFRACEYCNVESKRERLRRPR